MFLNFDGSTADFQFVEKAEWLRPLGIGYHMGVDGISMFFRSAFGFPDAGLHYFGVGQH
jgi:NADH:ubiquinone oxidoreductase subunit 4 (subunit M)